MKIAMIVEGDTEAKTLKEGIVRFLRSRTDITMPSISMKPQGRGLPKNDALKRPVDNLCQNHDAVIALTDVHLDSKQVIFADVADAKNKMQKWVGENGAFYPHAAQYDFEAWLIPYWETIQKLSGSNIKMPPRPPEEINSDEPPAHLLKRIFMSGGGRVAYVKPRDATRILKYQDLVIAANACPELKSLLNTILTLSGGTVLP